jgi:dTDP-4-dehydrorhamnose 3,5-epimerase-like enzyme
MLARLFYLRKHLWHFRMATIVIAIAQLTLMLVYGPWAFSDFLIDLAKRNEVINFAPRLLLFMALLGGTIWGGVTKKSSRPIRGMHLQVDQASNWRFIQVLHGQAFDVLLDLRRGEETFLQTRINSMSAESPQTLVVPPGVAHGFQAVTDVEILYLTSHRYDAGLDKGVNPFSIGIQWPVEVTSVSHRDMELPTLEEYIK